ncbi:MAG: fibro-slime domain-containing protein [Acutalibacteraceae bacterium]
MINNDLFKKAIKFIKENKKRRIWFRIGVVFAAIVVFVTTYALILPAITMENKTICGLEEHTHMYDCYDHITVNQEKKMICADKLPGIHKHQKSCYDENGDLICGYADYLIHEHSELCYDDSGNLVCTLEEHKKHKHTDECYETRTVLVCDKAETTLDKDAESSGNKESSAYVSVSEGNEKNSDSETTAVHVHTSECYKTDKVLVCGKQEIEPHTHDESCYDGNKLICGKLQTVEHEHSESCFEVTGGEEKAVLICKKPEHKHSEECYEQKSDSTGESNGTTESEDSDNKLSDGKYTEDFSYEDDEIAMVVHVNGDEELPEETKLQVSSISEDSESYRLFAEYSENNDNGDSDQLIAKSVDLVSNGETLDSSAYSLVADITVKEDVIEPIQNELSGLEDVAPDALVGVMITSLEETDSNQISETESVLVPQDESSAILTVSVTNRAIVLLASTTANPTYKVQYYANLPNFATSGNAQLTVIDTSGRTLPKNNSSVKVKNMYISETSMYTNQNAGNQTKLYQVAKTVKLTEIYSSAGYEYIKAPNPAYVNKLIDNTSYSLKEVWVLKSGKSETSIDRNDWNIYGADIHFTNRESYAASDIIYISDNTVIRFVYDCAEASFSAPATFYDYNISSGLNRSSRWKTGITGINIESNYGASRNGQRTWSSYADVFAFGNANCGTGLDGVKFSNGYLNKLNITNSNIDSNTKGCTFQLAESFDTASGNIVYNTWLVAPKLFNEGSANGKQTYEGSSLGFTRVGDNYTLTSATLNDNGQKTISNLQYFFNPSPNTSQTHTHIFTNNFWPMDSASGRTDPLFGAASGSPGFAGFTAKTSSSDAWKALDGTFPPSDDGNAHNSFFGLQYAVKFKLTSDYVGPLEYVFYGDDDMWVFLDNTLVCDIGGVHSSVGEYVNLWDYLTKGDEGEHTLTLFYTERGASGSTCYMNFTLPSVTGINIEQKTTDLRIEKEVVGKKTAGQEYEFSIRLYDSDGNEIKDDYAYSKYDADGTETDNDLVIHNGSNFTLKDGEYIIIKHLPYGIRYIVEETNSMGYTASSQVNGIVQSGSVAKGTVIKDVVNTVKFTNTGETLDIILQKVDVDGNPLSGAVFTLSQTGGSPVNFIKTASGHYSVPRESTEVFDTDEEYYIALNKDDSYVIGNSDDSAVIQAKTGSDYQKYKIYVQPDGSCSFFNVGSSKWLDLYGGILDNFNPLKFYSDAATPTNNLNQKWFLIMKDNGSLKIKPRAAVVGKNAAVVDMNTGVIQEGQRVQAYEDNGTQAQEWKLVPVNPKSSPATTTDIEVSEDGVLYLSSLTAGSYTLTEKTAPPDCKTISPIELTVGEDGKISLASSNNMVTVDGDGPKITVKNQKTDRKLTLKKEVIGSETTQSFSFTVSYKIDGQSVFSSTYELTDGAQEIIDIPYGAEVTVSEAKNNSFAVSYKSEYPITPDGNKCTFVIKDNMVLTATNTIATIELPKTGGRGTYMYTIAGAALIVAALTLMYSKNKSRKEEHGDL